MTATLAPPAPPPLRSGSKAGPRETRDNELLLRYHRHGDLDAREELAARFVPVARDLASRYRNTNEPLEDLVQVACLGLMKAIDRFEPGRGSRFMSYAVPTMVGELKRHFRDKGWALHVPRQLDAVQAARALTHHGRDRRLPADVHRGGPRGPGGRDGVRRLVARLPAVGHRGRERHAARHPRR